MSANCLFCKIVAGQIPAYKVFEDNDTLAFMDINPGAEGHLLVIPKTHAENLFDIPEPVFLATMKTARRVGKAVQSALGVSGLNLFQSSGTVAFQTVFHFHMHLLPRRERDNLQLPWLAGHADPEQLNATAHSIAKAID